MSNVNNYTTCVKITRVDGTILGITELDKNLNISGIDYIASAGYTPTEFDSTADLSVNNADLEGLLTNVGVSREDIVAGLYDYAGIEFFLFDYESYTKIRDLGKGKWGESTLVDGKYVTEYRSLTQTLQHTVGKVYGAECSASLGDSNCGVTLATYTVTGTVTSVTNNATFSDSTLTEADGYFNYGLLTFTSGLNSGTTLAKEVRSFSSDEFSMQLPMPYEVQVGDTYSVYAGCDKRDVTCIAKFNNIINFRGFPFIPGQDQTTKFGGQ